MWKQIRDRSLDTPLDLDGQVFVVDPTPARPHGLNYSLTLHAENGERLVGFDNAHPMQPIAGPGGKSRKAQDHKHRLRIIRPYDYKDSATDFWTEVDAVLRERGVIP